MKKVFIALIVSCFVANAQATPIVYEGFLDNGVTATGDVPLNSYTDAALWDYWSFFGTAGDVVSITLDRASGQMDPGVNFYFGTGIDTAGLTPFSNTNSNDGALTFLAQDDDGGSDVPSGPFNNSLISGFTLASTGTYTVAAYDVVGSNTGPWTYNLTVTGITSVPAPASIALFGLGLMGFGFSRKRKTA